MSQIGIADAPKSIKQIIANSKLWEQLQGLHEYNNIKI